MARVRFEPVGVEIDCALGETILESAFRHGLNLAHGCREGQCSACRAFLLAGEVTHGRHSSFALSDAEAGSGYALMCRAMPETDLVVELLHHDPDGLALEHPPRGGEATVTALEHLTADVVRLILAAPELEFTPGQYVDLHVPGGGRRSFSMANLPGEGRIELLIRRYPGGKLSGMLGGGIVPGATLAYTGPYGTLRLHDGDAPLLLIAGGTGLAPILSLLRQLAASGEERPVRLWFAAREPFCLESIHAAGERLPRFELELLRDRTLPEAPLCDVYMCGPAAMLDELAQTLHPGCRVFADRFTASADASDAVAALDERSFAWFAPRGRRATLYEDVTVDTQPSVQRHLARGWLVSFEDGRGTWDSRSTALASRDWYAFRDPGELWELPFYREQSALERELEAGVNSALAAGLLDDVEPGWAQLLRGHLQVAAFVEHGLWFATATIGRDCLSDTVAHCVCLQAAMKQRSAQAIVLAAMALEPFLGPLPLERAREVFVSEPAWQPTRRYLERLAAAPDWGEVIIAANLAFEPLIGTLLRRELGIRAAGACADPVTPALGRAAEREAQWTLAWSAELCRFLLADPVHGERNRATLGGWLRDWMPEALASLDALAAGVAVPIDRARVLAAAAGVLRTAGLAQVADELGLGAGDGARDARRKRRAEVANWRSPPPENGSSNGDYVGVVIARSGEGDAIAAALAGRPGVEVLEQPSFWEVRARGRIVIRYDELSERLGYAIDAYGLQRELSTHYGRMVAGDEALMLFADPTEALGHLLA